LDTLLVNVTMIQGLLGFGHVDGVYWTLEVELLFYAGMLMLFCLGRLHQIHAVLLLLLGLRIANVVLEWRFGFGIPWPIYRITILRYIPWFALGICVYLIARRPDGASLRAPLTTAGCALLALALGDTLMLAGLALVLAGIVLLAAMGRLGVLRLWPFVWLGSISYPLYLLHENIGWSIRLRLGDLGMSTDLAILIVLALSLVLATALTYTVEQPAMRWIRERYRSRLALSSR
ncbi:MAG: acyltransferase, partial [Rhodocyclaceae bacterium]|nr:acyltransferase [Rhodocyclaceae bacterium]